MERVATLTIPPTVAERGFVDDRPSGDAFVRRRKPAILVRVHHIQPDIYSAWTLEDAPLEY